MSIFCDAIRGVKEYESLLSRLKEIQKSAPLPIAVNGLCAGATEVLIEALIQDVKTRDVPHLLLCENEKECQKYLSVLSESDLNVLFYPHRDFTYYNITSSHDYEHQRLSVLSALKEGAVDLVVTTPDAALSYTMPTATFEKGVITIDIADTVDPKAFSQKLLDAGYVRADMAENVGQFSLRGDIVDVYPPSLFATFTDGTTVRKTAPVRLELFDTEIDRLGLFDAETQRLTDNLSHVSFTPCREIIPDGEAYARLKTVVEAELEKAKSENAKTELTHELSIVTRAESGSGEVQFIDKYINVVYPEKTCLIDYLTRDSLLLISNTTGVVERLEASQRWENQVVADLMQSELIKGSLAEYAHGRDYFDGLKKTFVTLFLDSITRQIGGNLGGLFSFTTRSASLDLRNKQILLDEIHDYIKAGYKVVLTSDNTVDVQYIKVLFEEIEYPLSVDLTDLSLLPTGGVCLLQNTFVDGFELPGEHVVFFATADRATTVVKTNKKMGYAAKNRIKTQSVFSFNDLEEGDIVVHDDYGIAQYKGIIKHTVLGVTRDYITLQFACNESLYIPVEKLLSVSKYVGAREEDGSVRLSRISGDGWKKAKAKTKAAASIVAKDLIALYAERMRRPGYAFQPDDENQINFEESFPFEETEGQLKAAKEIKNDMMSTAPMDRLLCGDVGYGKTEVALRAAYKAVLGGKQVCILVPTTLLATQHYQTILARMRAFAVNVDVLSRFRSPKEQKEIISRLADGKIDILVGTHRLLSKDIKFHSLGLVIIDEEQRFGVAQKEKLKQLCKNVDVLSLSATPIPRTLNMAMGGIRDISVLDEAPRDRLPVQTYVLEENDLIIEDAIRRELRRGGQVFYLYNDTERIYSLAQEWQEKIPEARITVAHGKMDKDELEDIWESMLKGDIDMLVCTTIIETGIDIPNANTLIVKNAQRLGLSQLHQLRGRIGRSVRRAYAYFTMPAYVGISDVAMKRLNAIKEFAEFGSGFRIAMRDMEIRGAGELLGEQQHGHMEAVGYEMYIRLLNKAVLEEKGVIEAEEINCNVSISVDAFLPETYVPYPAQRLSLYKRIAQIETTDELSDMTDELLDRFGELPKQTTNLLYLALIHNEAGRAGIKVLKENDDHVAVFPVNLDFSKWKKTANAFPGQIKTLSGTSTHVKITPQKKTDVLLLLHQILLYYNQL